MTSKRLSSSRLNEWVQSMLDGGWRVVGPTVAGAITLFGPVKSAAELVLGKSLTRKSPKGVFFPQSERILKYRQKGGKVELEDIQGFAPPVALLGVHPCDAASMDILDAVFSSKYADKFYLERRRNTVVVSLGCPGLLDDDCFCTSVGVSPDSRKGADIYTMLEDSGDLYMEILTDRGRKLAERFAHLLEDAEPQPARDWTGDELPFDLAEVKAWLDEHFDDEFWRELALRCAGCGTCAYICPTCHCFDITDETRLGEGVRRKNWDSCQFGLFTKHASGHNPRGDQSARFRQRVMHKFKYYADNFGSTLCVGCGRCVRSCPVGQSLLEVLSEISREAKSQKAVQG